jgi:hypothetical protein
MPAWEPATVLVIPEWAFTNINGSYAVDASTNLNDWWPAAEVYRTTNITVISDTQNKCPILFYRIRSL